MSECDPIDVVDVASSATADKAHWDDVLSFAVVVGEAHTLERGKMNKSPARKALSNWFSSLERPTRHSVLSRAFLAPLETPDASLRPHQCR